MKMEMMVRASALLGLALTLAAGSADAQVGKSKGLIYPELATQAELAALPNMNAELAKWIVDNRPFTGMKAIDDKLKATLDSAKRIQLYERMYMPINLNALVVEEIAMIPGAGRRMIREFNEYAPYVHLAVWYREIDKYIDEPAIGTLQQYVFVPMNVNSAKDEDLLTIPGLTAAKLDALKKGRPWADEARFRTEMAKSMDAKEVQRISRYLVFR